VNISGIEGDYGIQKIVITTHDEEELQTQREDEKKAESLKAEIDSK